MSVRKSERGKERGEKGLLIGGLIFAALILFFFIFRIDGYSVTGNYHASDQEIIEYVMQGPFSYNTVFLAMSYNDREVDDSFIEKISVDMKSTHTIEVRVAEKKLIGSVFYNGSYWYFDTRGIVRVRSDFCEADYREHLAGKSFSEIREAAAKNAAGTESGNAGTAGGTAGSANGTTGAAGTANGAAGSVNGTAADSVNGAAGSSNGTSESGVSGSLRKGNGNYIPVVTGLSLSAVSVGQPLAVLFTNVFPGLRELKKYVDGGGYEPDSVEYTLDGEMLLTFGGIVVNIGSFTEIEEELYVMNNILPSLEGLSGILHMENYDGSSNRLIFSKNEKNS